MTATLSVFRFKLSDGSGGTFVLDADSEAFRFSLDDRMTLFDDAIASRLGKVTYAGGDYTTHKWASREAQFVDAIEAHLASSTGVRHRVDRIEPARLGPGAYYPRIWRHESGPSPRNYCAREFMDGLVAYQNLERDLYSLFRTLEPAHANDDAYGYEVRELLILACTEVELLLRAVLVANGISARRWTTTEYVRAAEPLALGSWEVALADYPDRNPLSPFSGWTTTQPTRSLPWYDAYNAVKHNRREEFHRASLANAVLAVSGVFVLLAAQFGVGTEPLAHLDLGIRAFNLRRRPDWDPAEQYVPPTLAGAQGWTPENYPF